MFAFQESFEIGRVFSLSLSLLIFGLQTDEQAHLCRSHGFEQVLHSPGEVRFFLRIDSFAESDLQPIDAAIRELSRMAR